MKKYGVLLVLFGAGVLWSVINPHDYFTWFLETFPAFIAFLLLTLTFKKFRWTDLAYWMILIHCLILFVGGHYTYAEVPLFDTIKELFHQSRNNYDKVGHFAQGFVPALLARELFIRKAVVKRGGWVVFLTISVSLSISALYELLEWFVAETSGTSADAFLGTQGYVWDTQSDMLFALIGAISMNLLLSRIHDRQLEQVKA